jgi:predicted TIM-barrel enzyme
VLHLSSRENALGSVRTAVESDADGVFLIDHGMSAYELLALIPEVNRLFPQLWLGVNIMPFNIEQVFAHVVNTPVSGIWRDNAYIDERTDAQPRAAHVQMIRARYDWDGLYFGGVAFKYQRPVADAHLGQAAQKASKWMDVITTSGPATGTAADITKVQLMREEVVTHPIALASGVSCENVELYLPYVDAFLVESDIETYPYSGVLVPERTRRLATMIHQYDIKSQ